MSRDDWDDDAALFADLRAAMAEDVDPPQSVRDAGYVAFGWRTIDAELVELTGQALTGDLVRAGGGPVRLAFAGSDLAVELERDGDVLRGQLVPLGSGRIELIGGPAGTEPITVSDDGYFVIRDLPATSIRLRITTAAGAFLTPWFGPDG